MANIIDHTFFIGEINLPTSNAEAQSMINVFIKQFEPKLLTEILGYNMYQAFEAGRIVAEPEQRWTDLLNGVEFTHVGSGNLMKWEGLKIVDGTFKRSLIANYVYWHIQRNNATNTTTIGEVGTAAENGVRVSSKRKMATAWNSMVDSVRSLKYFLDSSENYPEFTGYSFPYHLFHYQSPLL